MALAQGWKSKRGITSCPPGMVAPSSSWTTKHTDRYADMVESGIIDPANVTRSALQNAVSIAGMILTTEVLITDLPEKEQPAAPAMPEY